MLDMSPGDLKFVADHMGHDLNIHSNIYSLQTSLVERAKVARVLVAVDNGNLHKLESLTDIDKIDANLVIEGKFWQIIKKLETNQRLFELIPKNIFILNWTHESILCLEVESDEDEQETEDFTATSVEVDKDIPAVPSNTQAASTPTSVKFDKNVPAVPSDTKAASAVKDMHTKKATADKKCEAKELLLVEYERLKSFITF